MYSSVNTIWVLVGAALVFLMKKQSEDGPCMGFAAGVMSAAAVFSIAGHNNSGAGIMSATLGAEQTVAQMKKLIT